MGLPVLPDELLLLTQQWPCREVQLRQLSSLLPADTARPSPSTLVLHGPRATGKSSVLSAYLEQQAARYAIVRCKECITGRHLLERTVAAVHERLQDGLQNGAGDAFNGRCENLSALTVHLQRLLQGGERFVLVFDGVDKQRDAPPTLLPALARLGEFVPNLTAILVVQHASAYALHSTGVPHLHFSPYNRKQSIHILSQNPPAIFLQPPPDDMEYDDEQHDEDKAWLWPRFCAAVWDSLGQSVARDLGAFRDVCNRLWRPFVAPIVKGDFGTRDFSRLLVAQRRLFQDDQVLLHSIVSAPPQEMPPAKPASTSKTHELPYYAKWLLVAAYLASYTPTKMDAVFFMKTSDRKKRKRGGGTSGRAGRPSQTRKVPRHLLAPSAFPLDRLLSILHAILPHDLRTTIDVYTQIATLSSLRLMVRSGGLGGTAGDPLERGSKWRVGAQVGWEYVSGLARSVQFDLGEQQYIPARFSKQATAPAKQDRRSQAQQQAGAAYFMDIKDQQSAAIPRDDALPRSDTFEGMADFPNTDLLLCGKDERFDVHGGVVCMQSAWIANRVEEIESLDANASAPDQMPSIQMPPAMPDETLRFLVNFFYDEDYDYKPHTADLDTRMAQCCRSRPAEDRCVGCKTRIAVEEWIAHANVSVWARRLQIPGLSALAEKKGRPAHEAALRIAKSHWLTFIQTVYTIPRERSGALRKTCIDGCVQLWLSKPAGFYPFAREWHLVMPPAFVVDVVAGLRTMRMRGLPRVKARARRLLKLAKRREMSEEDKAREAQARDERVIGMAELVQALKHQGRIAGNSSEGIIAAEEQGEAEMMVD